MARPLISFILSALPFLNLMSHKLVNQLKFVRASFLRGLEGLSAEDAERRIGNSNSISWIIGHLASFEQYTHCIWPLGKQVSAAVQACDFGLPASTPSYALMRTEFDQVVALADSYLDQLTEADMTRFITRPNGEPVGENSGTMILRHIWHYWYHIGEVQGIRQGMGHENLPQYVGRVPADVKYEPNAAKQLVDDMVNGLNRHEIGGMEKYWSEDMHWYGPAGIGLKPSLKAFQEEHQKPFLHAFPNKEAFDEIRIAEGDYVAAKGYQQVTHGGDYLGIPATNKEMQIKYMDFWRAEDGKLVENWVMIDLFDFLEQAGYNVEKVLKFIGSKPPEFFE